MPPNTWQARNCSVNWTVRKHIIAYRWLTNNQLRCWHSLSLVAYRPLAQGHSRALSTFSSFMREYLDKVIKADQCARYVDAIGIAAKDADHLIASLGATFKCIQEAGLKLTMHKCHFGATEIGFLERTITPQGVKPQTQNVQKFLEKTKFPESKKALQRYLGFLSYYKAMSHDYENAFLHSTRF